MHSRNERRKKALCVCYIMLYDIDSFYWRNECRKHCCWYYSARPLFSLSFGGSVFFKFPTFSCFSCCCRTHGFLRLSIILYQNEIFSLRRAFRGFFANFHITSFIVTSEVIAKEMFSLVVGEREVFSSYNMKIFRQKNVFSFFRMCICTTRDRQYPFGWSSTMLSLMSSNCRHAMWHFLNV